MSWRNRRPRLEREDQRGWATHGEYADTSHRPPRQGGGGRAHRRAGRTRAASAESEGAWDDRVLLVLLVVPVVLVGVVSYGGEIILRTYLFMLPAGVRARRPALLPGPASRAARRWSRRVLAATRRMRRGTPVRILPGPLRKRCFRAGPAGRAGRHQLDLCARPARRVRLLWLSTDSAIDVTPQMPWSYRDLARSPTFPRSPLRTRFTSAASSRRSVVAAPGRI